jgi:hypothetical protein
MSTPGLTDRDTVPPDSQPSGSRARLGAHERTVLDALAQAPAMLPVYLEHRSALRDRLAARLLDDDRSRLHAGRLVPTCYLLWWLPGIHRSTFSRTLGRLEEKGYLARCEMEGEYRSCGSAVGSYTKFVTLTNALRKC